MILHSPSGIDSIVVSSIDNRAFDCDYSTCSMFIGRCFQQLSVETENNPPRHRTIDSMENASQEQFADPERIKSQINLVNKFILLHF